MPHVTRGLRAAVTAAAAATLAVGVADVDSGGAAQYRAGRDRRNASRVGHRVRTHVLAGGDLWDRHRPGVPGRAGPGGPGLLRDGRIDPGQRAVRPLPDPAQVMARYGPTQAQVSAVSSWLTGAGLTVTTVKDEMGGYVAVQGSVRTAAQRVRRDVRDLPGTGPPGRPRAGGDRERARGRGQRRADRQRARHGHPRHDPALPHSARCRRLARTTGSLPRARSTTARRSRSRSRPPTGPSSRGRTAATRRARSAALTA